MHFDLYSKYVINIDKCEKNLDKRNENAFDLFSCVK